LHFDVIGGVVTFLDRAYMAEALNLGHVEFCRRRLFDVSLALVMTALLWAAWWLSKAMARPMAYAVHMADELAKGNLSMRMQPDGNEEMVQLITAMSHMQTNFGGIVRSVKVNADSVATASAEIASGNQDLSASTEHQASALQQTASSMDEPGAAVKQNADSAAQANQLAKSARTVTIQGGEVVRWSMGWLRP